MAENGLKIYGSGIGRSQSIIEANGCIKDCDNALIAGILTLL